MIGGIPRFKELPRALAAFKAMRPYILRLDPDTEESAPCSRDEMIEFLSLESGYSDAIGDVDIDFLRTGQVLGRKYWLWLYRESDGRLGYPYIEIDENGRNITGVLFINADLGLKVEQVMTCIFHWGLIQKHRDEFRFLLG